MAHRHAQQGRRPWPQPVQPRGGAAVRSSLGPSVLDRDVLAFHVAELGECHPEDVATTLELRVRRRVRREPANARHFPGRLGVDGGSQHKSACDGHHEDESSPNRCQNPDSRDNMRRGHNRGCCATEEDASSDLLIASCPAHPLSLQQGRLKHSPTRATRGPMFTIERLPIESATEAPMGRRRRDAAVSIVRFWPGLPVRGQAGHPSFDSAGAEWPVFEAVSSTSRPGADVRRPWFDSAKRAQAYEALVSSSGPRHSRR